MRFITQAARLIRPLSRTSYAFPWTTLCFPLRPLSISSRVLADGPHASHSTREAPRDPSSGEPVSDTSKEDESKRTGIPDEEVSIRLATTPAPSLFSLTNRTTIVTGGGRGLGLTVLYALLESGSSVAAVDVLPEPAQPAWGQALSLARSKSLDLTYHSLDVTNAQSTAGVFTDIFASAPENRPVRGLFCSAGITLLVPAVEQTPEQFRTVLDVNLTGSFFCAQAFAREYTVRNPPPAEAPGADEVESGKLKEDTSWKGRGASIVLTGSMSATVANVGLDCISYNASKAGVVQMGRNMAMEWGRKGIRVNSLSPGYIRTALTAALLAQDPSLEKIWLHGSLMGRISTPDEFRGPVIYLLSDASSYMTGADMLVDGGHTAI